MIVRDDEQEPELGKLIEFVRGDARELDEGESEEAPPEGVGTVLEFRRPQLAARAATCRAAANRPLPQEAAMGMAPRGSRAWLLGAPHQRRW